MVIAIDPGPVQSALVVWDGESILRAVKEPNDEIMARLTLCYVAGVPLVVEMIASYGMTVGAEVFETCVWIGRYIQAYPGPSHRVPRMPVKMHLCHSPKANDSNIRQAIIDRFGGKDKAIGKKKTPGPLYGISGDLWAALALAITFHDQNSNIVNL